MQQEEQEEQERNTEEPDQGGIFPASLFPLIGHNFSCTWEGYFTVSSCLMLRRQTSGDYDTRILTVAAMDVRFVKE